MKKRTLILVLLPVITLLTLVRLFAHDDETPAAKPSASGSNIWNAAQEPTNWWNEIKQTHGRVGPWNVLGWRMGKAALRELNATWGQHELDVICYIPLKTPTHASPTGWWSAPATALAGWTSGWARS